MSEESFLATRRSETRMSSQSYVNCVFYLCRYIFSGICVCFDRIFSTLNSFRIFLFFPIRFGFPAHSVSSAIKGRGRKLIQHQYISVNFNKNRTPNYSLSRRAIFLKKDFGFLFFLLVCTSKPASSVFLLLLCLAIDKVRLTGIAEQAANTKHDEMESIMIRKVCI